MTGPDLAEALAAVVGAPSTQERTYYPCHPQVFTSREFADAVGTALGRQVSTPSLPEWFARAALTVTGTAARLAGQATILNADKANEFFQTAWTGDPTPLTRDTGWSASMDLAAGLALTTQWYREAGWL